MNKDDKNNILEIYSMLLKVLDGKPSKNMCSKEEQKLYKSLKKLKKDIENFNFSS